MTRVKMFAEGIVAKGLLDRIVDLIGKEFLQELLQGLLRGMLDCDAPADGAEAKATVQRNYKGNGRYRGRFFARVSRIARQKARLLEGGLSRESSHEVAFVTLEQIRLGKDQEMSIMIQEGNRKYSGRVSGHGFSLLNQSPMA